ncbi:hypothetical protein [Nonomuraea sp. NPDC049480]
MPPRYALGGRRSSHERLGGCHRRLGDGGGGRGLLAQLRTAD